MADGDGRFLLNIAEELLAMDDGRVLDREHLAEVVQRRVPVYDKADERRLRARIDEFEVATRRAGHGWRHLDLTDAFGHWMAEQEYRDSFFESPEDLDLLLPELERSVHEKRWARREAGEPSEP